MDVNGGAKPVAILFAALLSLGLAVAAATPAEAKTIKCKRGEVSVPDDREGGGNLCMSAKERDKAKAICRKIGSSDWMECTCQDADTVGACGD